MSSEFDARDSKNPDESISDEPTSVNASDGLANPIDATADQDKYLHPISLVFSLISQIRSNVIPAIFGLLGAANGELLYIVLALVFLVPSVGLSIVRYFTVRYRISNGELVVNEGLFFRRTRTVPVGRIQNIDLVQGILHRMFKVAEVRVETASGTKPEAVLSVLSLTQVELLRRNVFKLKSDNSASGQCGGTEFDGAGEPIEGLSLGPNGPCGGEETDAAVSPWRQTDDVGGTTLLEIPIGWLAKAGFASNRGFIMVGVMLGLYFQFDSRVGEDYDFSFIQQWLPTLDNVFFAYAAAAGAVAVGLLMLRVLGVGWYILRFFGYRLSLVGDDFKVACGLFTKVSATVPRERVQFISIHNGLIARMMGLASIRIETAGGSSSQNEDATTTISRRWFIPVIPAADVDAMVSQLRPDVDWSPGTFDWQPLSVRAKNRFMRIAVFIALVLGPIGYLYFGLWGLCLTPVAMPVFLWVAVKKSRSVRYARTPFGVVYRSGILTRKLSLTFFEKIQIAETVQTPFDRRWGMATLVVDTAAAGPADHKIEIKYLDAVFANQEYGQILKRASR